MSSTLGGIILLSLPRKLSGRLLERGPPIRRTSYLGRKMQSCISFTLRRACWRGSGIWPGYFLGASLWRRFRHVHLRGDPEADQTDCISWERDWLSLWVLRRTGWVGWDEEILDQQYIKSLICNNNNLCPSRSYHVLSQRTIHINHKQRDISFPPPGHCCLHAPV